MFNLTKHIAKQNISLANNTIEQVTQMARNGKFNSNQIEQLSVALDQLKRALYREGHAIAFNEELNQDQWEEYNV